MREEPTWFARWEEDLPSPEELMPLTQTLITPDLALAFDIPSPGSATAAAGAEFLRQGISHNQHHLHNHHIQQKESAFPPSSQPSPAQSQGHHQSQLQQHHLGQAAAAAADYDSSELGGSASGGNGGAGSGGDEQARTLKRPRLVWTPQLHKRFVDAVAHLGIKNAVPKTIMQLMSVEGLTRENVASHLQKYRLYLKRMQGLSGGPGGGGVGQISHADSATEQLFASGPVPHPLLHHRGPTAAPVGAGGADQYFPFASMGSLHPHQPPSHQQQMAAAAAAAAAAANYQQQQQQYYQQHRQHQQQQQILGSPPGNGFDHGLFGAARQQTQHQHHPAAAAIALQRMMAPVGVGIGAAAGFGSSPFGEDLDSGVGTGGAPERRKELTLFPTNDG